MQCVTAIILIIDHIYKKKLRHINFRLMINDPSNEKNNHLPIHILKK